MIKKYKNSKNYNIKLLIQKKILYTFIQKIIDDSLQKKFIDSNANSFITKFIKIIRVKKNKTSSFFWQKNMAKYVKRKNKKYFFKIFFVTKRQIKIMNINKKIKNFKVKFVSCRLFNYCSPAAAIIVSIFIFNICINFVIIFKSFFIYQKICNNFSYSNIQIKKNSFV
jgi:hypothetical protein